MLCCCPCTRRRQEAEIDERRQVEMAGQQLAATQAEIAALRSELIALRMETRKEAQLEQRPGSVDGELDKSSITCDIVSRRHTAGSFVQPSIDHGNHVVIVRYMVPPPTRDGTAFSRRDQFSKHGRVRFQLAPTEQESNATVTSHPSFRQADATIASARSAVSSTPSATANGIHVRPGTAALTARKLGHTSRPDGLGKSGHKLAMPAEQLEARALVLEPGRSTPTDELPTHSLQLVKALEPGPEPEAGLTSLLRREGPGATRPPSPFMAQLDFYFKQVAAESARAARLVPSDVWTEVILRETAVHDWPSNLSRRWCKFCSSLKLACHNSLLLARFCFISH